MPACRMGVTALNPWLSSCSWWGDQCAQVSVRSEEEHLWIAGMTGNVLQANGWATAAERQQVTRHSVLITPALSLWEFCAKKLKDIVFSGFILKVTYVVFKSLLVQCLWSCSLYIWAFLIGCLVTLRSLTPQHWCDRTKFAEPCVQSFLLCQSVWLL